MDGTQKATAGNPGFVSITGSSCATSPTAAMITISGSGPWTILVGSTFVCNDGQAFTLTYGGSGATKVTAPTTTGPNTFAASSKIPGEICP